MKTLVFAAVACLLVVEGAGLSRRHINRDLKITDNNGVISYFDPIPVELSIKDLAVAKKQGEIKGLKSETYVCILKYDRTKRQVCVGQTLPRQNINGQCIECSVCTKQGMECSRVQTKGRPKSKLGLVAAYKKYGQC
ncbi:hypothetical protein LSAT2_005995 [Lamellibrachia satsuma]|nr:hypothetical protein LSAT2_005995 [Lamellibrachia satsuma]